MANDDRTKIIPRRTPELAAMLADVKRAMAITANLNRLTINDADESPSPVQRSHRQEGGRQLYIDPAILRYRRSRYQCRAQCFRKSELHFLRSWRSRHRRRCDDRAEREHHHVWPSCRTSRRRASVIAKPIVIERNVWIAAGATIIGGVTVGENSVVAAGSVVTKNVPPNTLVGGNPARVIRSIGDTEGASGRGRSFPSISACKPPFWPWELVGAGQGHDATQSSPFA